MFEHDWLPEIFSRWLKHIVNMAFQCQVIDKA